MRRRTPLLRLILPAALRKRDREQKYRLLPAAIREHAEAARLDNTYPHYGDVTADVLLMAGKDATATAAGRASESLLPVLPTATLTTFPALDHLGPEKKPKQVAGRVGVLRPGQAGDSMTRHRATSSLNARQRSVPAKASLAQFGPAETTRSS